MNENSKAAASYEKAIELDPEQMRNYLYLGTLYARMKEHDKGIETLQRLLEVKPESVMAYYYLAKLEAERSNHAVGRRVLPEDDIHQHSTSTRHTTSSA